MHSRPRQGSCGTRSRSAPRCSATVAVLARRTSRRPDWWAPPIALRGDLSCNSRPVRARRRARLHHHAHPADQGSTAGGAAGVTAAGGGPGGAVHRGTAGCAAVARVRQRRADHGLIPASCRRGISSPASRYSAALVRGEPFASAYNQRLREMRGMMAMPPAFDGGVDMLGHWQGLLIANRSPYRPGRYSRATWPTHRAWRARRWPASLPAMARPMAAVQLRYDRRSSPAIDHHDADLWPLLLTLYQPAGQVDDSCCSSGGPRRARGRLVPLGARTRSPTGRSPFRRPTVDRSAARIDVARSPPAGDDGTVAQRPINTSTSSTSPMPSGARAWCRPSRATAFCCRRW